MTTTVHPNARLARRAWKALLEGDEAAIGRAFASDVTWHLAGTSAIAGDYDGIAELKRLFTVLGRATSGTFTGDVDAVVADEHLAILLLHVQARRNGSRLDTRDAVVFQTRDGRVSEAWVYEGDPTEDSFWRSLFGVSEDSVAQAARTLLGQTRRSVQRTATIPPPQVYHQAPRTKPRPDEIAQAPSGLRRARVARAPLGPQLRKAGSVLVSEFGLHGLAYLGVLLMFAGTFGLVFFAFGDVRVGLRPAAEAAIPISFFAATAILRGRGAPFVSRGLELVGGALLPVVVYASFVDAAMIPPDVHGLPLVAVLTSVSVALGAAYAVWSTRRSESMLRYLIAPMAWLAAGTATIGARSSGFDVRTIDATQGAVIVAAVAVTLAVSTRIERFTREISVAALPGLVVAYVLAMLASGRGGWPAGQMLAAGLGAAAAIALLERRFGGGMAPALIQYAVIAGAATAIGWHYGRGWAGATVVLVFIGLIEWRGLTRAAPTVVAAGLAVVAIAAGVSTSGRAAPLLAFAALTVWSHVRRIVTPDWAPAPVWTWSAAIAPIGLFFALGNELVPEGPLMIAGASAVFGAALALTRRTTQDRFWTSALGGWAATIAVVALAEFTVASSLQVAVAAGVVGAAFIALRLPIALRAWAAASCYAISTGALLDATSATSSQRLIIWSSLGLAAILVGLAVRADASGHLIAIGHLTAVATVLVPDIPDATGIVVLVLLVAGFAATVVARELGVAPLVELIARADARIAPWFAAVPIVATLVGLPRVLADVFDYANASPRWLTGTLAAVALAYAALTRRLASREPLTALLAHGAVGVSIASFVIARGDVPMFVAATLTAASVVAVMHESERRPWLVWFGWAVTAPFVVRTAEWAGVEPADLGFALLGWGITLAIGSLAADDVLAGRRPIGRTVRTPWLVPAAVLGALGILTGVVLVAGQPATVRGWTATALTAVFATLALQLHAGVVTLGAYAFATLAAASLLPWAALDHPWMLAIWTAVLVGAWWASRRYAPRSDVASRWDLPPFVVAHGVAVVALFASTDAGSLPATWTSIGALAVFVALAGPDRMWAPVGVALMLIGAGAAGGGWLALALAGTSAAAMLVATKSEGATRRTLQAAAVVAAAGAWIDVVVWRDWASPRWVAVAAVLGGAVMLAAVSLHRFALVSRDWVPWWTGAGAAALVVASAAAPVAVANDFGTWAEAGSTSVRILKLLVGAGWMLAAGAGAIASKPFRERGIRDAAVISKLVSWVFVLWAIEPTVDQLAWIVTAMGLVIVTTALVIWRRDPGSGWLRPVTLGGAMVVLTSIGVASGAWPRRDLAIAALTVAGLEAAAASVVLRRPAVAVPAPVLLGAAWMLFASESLTGSPQWYSVPAGVAALAIVDLARADRAARKLDNHTRALLGLEALGAAFFVIPALVQTVSTDIAYSVLGIGLGIALAAWGAVTQVKRRLIIGATAILVAVFLLIGVPLTGLLTELRGAGLWLAISLFGLVLLVAAATIERTQAALRGGYGQLRRLVETWE